MAASDFDGKLQIVTIENDNGGLEEVLHDAELVQVKQYGEEWWFILRELSEDEKRARAIDAALIDLQAQADYIAMMTDVDL